MTKVQPESGSGKSNENRAGEIPDERIKKKVLLLELALMHRPTAASLTKPQLKMAAKECTLIEVYDYFLAKKYNESDELENDNDKKIFFDDLE